MSREKIVGEITAGEGAYPSEALTLKWKVRNFADIDQKHGDYLSLPDMKCHGHQWSLGVYPRGHVEDTEEDEEWVSIFLCLLRVNGAVCPVGILNCSFVLSAGRKTQLFKRQYISQTRICGSHKFIQRDELLDPNKKHLEDGNLIFKVTIQLHLDKPKPWLPKNDLGNDMLNLLNSGRRYDVIFLVDGRKFHAHSLILATRAPVLAELVKNNKKPKEVKLENVDKAVFWALLQYVYAAKIPADEVLENIAQQLLEAADRFGCTSLKLFAEAELVKSGIEAGDAANVLLDADARNCALLKEEALRVISASPNAAMSSPGWANLEKSGELMAEVMKATHSKPCYTNDSDYDNMDVSTLRRKLDEAGMGVDGTKGMLVKRLKSTHR